MMEDNELEPMELDNDFSDVRRVQQEAGFTHPCELLLRDVYSVFISHGATAAWLVTKKHLKLLMVIYH